MSQQGYPEIDSWVAAIYGAATGGGPIGGGVVIDDRRVLTCAHVAMKAAEGLWAEFPMADTATAVRCRVVSVSMPGDFNEDRDVAMLELADPIPDGVEPARLRCPAPKSLIGTKWWALGFPPAQPRGSVSKGEVGTALARGWVRIDVTSAYHIEPGFSGAGLWSPEFGAVVGIVAVYDEQRNGQALTIHQADRLLPRHGLRELAELSLAGDSGELALRAWGLSLTADPEDPRPVQAGRDAYAAGHDITINVYPSGGEVPPTADAAREAEGWSLAKDPENRRHWRPRARGVTIDSEKGYRFRGRTAGLAEIKAWLDREAPDRRVLVVTGDPGAGKSAVLGRIVTTADKDTAAQLSVDDSGVRATEGSVACAVHAKGATALEIAKQIARAASAAIPSRIEDFPPALRDALTDRAGLRFNVLIDALDESAEPRAVIAKVILPVAETCHDVGAQVVVGSRRNDRDGDLVAAFGGATHLVDLDNPQYFAKEDLAAYAHATLQLSGDPRPGNPYDQDKFAIPLSERIAQLSHPNFLVAGLTARTHGLYDEVPVLPGDLHFSPRVEEAMGEYLSRIPGVAGVPAETLLLPLAYAESPGLAVSLWRIALQAVGGGDVDEAVLRRFARSAAASFLVESVGAGGTAVFRLFHQALNDALLHARAKFVEPLEDEQALTRVFLGFGQEAGWDRVPAYLLSSLAIHAARAGMIDDLLADDTYLLYADLPRVQLLADRATSSTGQDRARLLRLASRAVITADASNRAAMFSVTETLEGLGSVYRGTTTSTPYLAEWAIAPPSTEHSVLRGHYGGVNVICAFSLDGTPYLATGGDDRTVRIWDPAAGAQLRALAGHEGAVRSVYAFTLDGTTYLAVGDKDGTIRIWDPATGTQLRALTGHKGAVRSICALTFRGITCLATGDIDRTVRIWDPATGTQLRKLTGPTSGVRSICTFPLNGTTYLATGGIDHAVRIWRPNHSNRYRTLTGHSQPIRSICTFTLNDTTCLATASDDCTIRIWDPATRTQLRTLTGHNSAVRSICAFTIDDTTYLATASLDNTVRIWDPATGSQLRTLTGHKGAVWSVCAFTLDDTTRLATGGDDCTIRIWDPATGTQLRTLTGHKGAVWSVCAFTLDDTTCLATGGNEHSVRIWDPATGTQLRTLTGHDKAVRSICAFTLHGTTRLATASDDRIVRVWDPAAGSQARALTGHNSGVRSICPLTINGATCLATGGNDGTVRIWNPATAISVVIIPTRDQALSISYADGLLCVGTKAGLIAIRPDCEFLERALRQGRPHPEVGSL